MVHVVEAVGAVLFRLAAILATYPHRGRVAVSDAEEFTSFEVFDRYGSHYFSLFIGVNYLRIRYHYAVHLIANRLN